jgi:hypothetical protein
VTALLWQENALRLSQSPLAGTLVASAVSITRSRHERLGCLYLLGRYVAQIGLGSGDRLRRRLSVHCGRGTLARWTSSSSYGLKLRINLRLHPIDLRRTWTS